MSKSQLDPVTEYFLTGRYSDNNRNCSVKLGDALDLARDNAFNDLEYLMKIIGAVYNKLQ